MKHIILLTHGEFSKGIAQSAEFILGKVPGLETLSITMDESIDMTIDKISNIIQGIAEREPIILITDIPGGSTTQAAIRSLEKYPDLYIISGLCLGMLIQLVLTDLSEDREENLAMLRELVEEARETLMVVNDICRVEELGEDDGEL